MLASAVLLLLFTWICSQFYLPGKGFTYLIEFGDQSHARYLPELQAVNHYELISANGYDAQYYAQIAMDPHLGDPRLRDAVDSLPYRARRILLCWTAYALAGGNPAVAMHLYAVQNIACWFLLACLLWLWVPPRSFGNVARWAAILFGFGLCCSVRGALVDGPSLLFLAAAIALAERGRWWLAAVVIGVSTLVRETNLLAAIILLPAALPDRGQVKRTLLTLVVAVAPLVVWLVTLQLWVGRGSDAGARNFALPFAGYGRKWLEVAAQWKAHGFDYVTRGDLVVLVSLTVQWLFVVLRPRWRELWWRAAAPFALLAVFLGDAVWEGYPGAAARVLLPLSAAFCLLVPFDQGTRARRAGWWVAFVLGSLSVLVSFDVMSPPGRESVKVTGPRDLRIMPASGQTVDATFDAVWYGPEKSWLEYWRWSQGRATITFHNPHPFPVVADISFGLRANDDRTVSVEAGGRALWRGPLERMKLRPVTIANQTLPPGDSVWTFSSPTPPPVNANPIDPRKLSFSLRNLKIDLHPSP